MGYIPILPVGVIPPATPGGPFPLPPFPRLPSPFNPMDNPESAIIGRGRGAKKWREVTNRIVSRANTNSRLQKLANIMKKIEKIFDKLSEYIIEPLAEVVAPDLVLQYIMAIPYRLKNNGLFPQGGLNADTYNELMKKMSTLMTIGGFLSAVTGSDLGEELIESIIEPIVEETFGKTLTAYQKIYVGGSVPEPSDAIGLVSSGNINRPEILGLLSVMTGYDNIMAVETLWSNYLAGNWSYFSSLENNLNMLSQTLLAHKLRALETYYNIIVEQFRAVLDLVVGYFDYYFTYDEVLASLIRKLGRLIETLMVTNNPTTINNVYKQILTLKNRLDNFLAEVQNMAVPSDLINKLNNILNDLKTYLEAYFEAVKNDFVDVMNKMVQQANILLTELENMLAEAYNVIKTLRNTS